jgi:uncharacterized protein YbgA (DUF1722 family)/uncharacterized protein YbbK (DUF523 family)
MREFVRPTIIVSKCLGFAHCRYNGLTISDDFVEKLRPYVDFRPVCPEVEIGLGIPREPIRIVAADDELRLIQPGTDTDVTDKMTEFTNSFLNSAGDADGFILKTRSPSCGPKDVKVYPGTGKVMSTSRSAGFFGGSVVEKYPYLAVEDEGRLKNFGIREHFLTRLFAISSFRKVKESRSMKEIVRFHSENKYLLMAYNQEIMRVLGRIVANLDKKDIDELIGDYEKHLSEALSEEPKYTSNINVLMHGMGYFSEKISSSEKAFFLDSLDRYREGRIPLSVPLNVLRSFIIRFQENYLMQQTFFEPYPEELVEISDSGKGRNL